MALNSFPSRFAAFAVPYVAVAIGLYGFHDGWLAFLLYHAGVVIVLSAARGWGHALEGFRVSGSPSLAAIALALIGVLSGILGGILMHLLWSWFTGPSETVRHALASVGLSGSRWLAFAGYHTLVNPWVEEAYWRGALAQPGWLIRADVAFAAYHILVLWRFVDPGPLRLSFLVLVVVAAFWRYTVRRTGSLWPAVLSHVAANGAIMWVIVTGTRQGG